MKRRYFLPLFLIITAALALSGCAAPRADSPADTSRAASSREEANHIDQTEVSADPPESATAKSSAVESNAAVESAAAEISEAEAASGDEAAAAGESPSGGFSLDDAKASFAESHTDAEIAVAKPEGNVYYIEGWDGNILFKMKFSSLNGEVLLDKAIQTGRRS